MKIIQHSFVFGRRERKKIKAEGKNREGARRWRESNEGVNVQEVQGWSLQSGGHND